MNQPVRTLRFADKFFVAQESVDVYVQKIIDESGGDVKKLAETNVKIAAENASVLAQFAMKDSNIESLKAEIARQDEVIRNYQLKLVQLFVAHKALQEENARLRGVYSPRSTANPRDPAGSPAPPKKPRQQSKKIAAMLVSPTTLL